MPAVLYEKRGHVAWITLNRPAAKNTLNAEAFVLLRDAWQAVRDDGEVRVAVLTATTGAASVSPKPSMIDAPKRSRQVARVSARTASAPATAKRRLEKSSSLAVRA